MATIKSIKEKAKAYDKALKEAVIAHKDEDKHLKATLERIFPELKESDDEKIMKALYKMAKVPRKEIYEAEGITKEQALAWLEKQGEQKSQGKSALEAINEEKVDNANKVEPRQEELTEFERAVKQVMEEAIECGDTHNLKADAEMLLSLVHKSAWSEEDKEMLNLLLHELEVYGLLSNKEGYMKNLFERIKRTGLLVRYYQTLHPDNTTCGCCGLPWAVVKPHSIDMVECTNEHSGHGFFPVCEWCWQNKPYTEIANAVTNLHDFWTVNGRQEGYEPPYSLQEMLKKTREDYEKAQEEAHYKAMEE